jgi:chemotaxis protein methyltransferase CheR
MSFRSSGEPRPRLMSEEFLLLRDVIYEHAGLSFDGDAMFLFDRRLGERVEALGLRSFNDYYKYIRFNARGPVELDEAIERLTTKETYFFRQEYQLRAFSTELLPRLALQNADSKRLCIWSAGCSTGEEAYTLAMLVRDSELFNDWEVRIIGSDICKTSVATARRGAYQSSSFRVTPDAMRTRYFREEANGTMVVDRVKQMCHFGQLNLLDAGRASMVGRVDVVFCRNVLIYFDLRSRRRVIDTLLERLLPGGYLLLGHSESLLNLSTAFELVHLREDLVYRKPLTTERWDSGARK